MTFERLEAKRHANEDGFPSILGLRARRCVSWLGRAEREMESEDHDVAFILYWIAFNAAYAEDLSSAPGTQRDAFDEYFVKIVDLDLQSTVYDAIWDRFSGSVRTLLSNRYVFQPFWNYYNGVPGGENWQNQFERSQRAARAALANKDTKRVLGILFDRLYVLRNQLVHGGATWNGSLNRAQVRDGARIMAFLVPLFIEIMMDNPSISWGAAYYPSITGS